MKKFINRIDHVTWLTRLENAEANVAMLEKVSGVKLRRSESKSNGFSMFINWSAGLEVVAPYEERTPFNEALHARLESHGEGLLGVVFGVENLEKHREKLEAMGMQVGPRMGEVPDSEWKDEVTIRERIGPNVMDSWFVLGEIDYADGVVSFDDI